MSHFRENEKIHDLLCQYDVDSWADLPLPVQFQLAKVSCCEFSFSYAVERLPQDYLDLLTLRMAEDFDADVMHELYKTIRNQLIDDINSSAISSFIDEEFQLWREIIEVENQKAFAHDLRCGRWA